MIAKEIKMRQLGRICNVGIVIDIVQLLHYISIKCAIYLLQLTVSRIGASSMQDDLDMHHRLWLR